MAMQLTGNVAGIIKMLGGGSDVVITPILLEGVAIAKITVDDTDFYIYAPEGGSDITVTPTLQAGTKIGDITIGENTVSLYAPNPTSVSVSQNVTEGTQIGSITVNGVTTNLFAPASGGSDIIFSVEPHKVGTWTDGTITKDVWECSFITSQSDQEVQHDLTSLNIDRMLVMNGIINLTNNISYPNPFYLNNSNYAGFRWNKPYLVTLICGDYWNRVISIEYTIRYTIS